MTCSVNIHEQEQEHEVEEEYEEVVCGTVHGIGEPQYDRRQEGRLSATTTTVTAS